jgi:hypothetical protein
MIRFESEFTQERMEKVISARKDAERAFRRFRREEYGLVGLTILSTVGAFTLGTFGLLMNKRDYPYSAVVPCLFGYVAYMIHNKKTVPAEERFDRASIYFKDELKTLEYLVEEGNATDNERSVFSELIKREIVEQEEGHNALLTGINARRARAILPYNGEYQHDPEATDGWLDELKE